MVRYPGRAAFVSLIIWFVVAMNRYMLAPSASQNFGSWGESLLLWVVTALVGFGGAFYYLLARTPNPPSAAAQFGVYAVILKGLFDLGLASGLEGNGPTPGALMASTAYWIEMAVLVVTSYLAGQVFVRARRS